MLDRVLLLTIAALATASCRSTASAPTAKSPTNEPSRTPTPCPPVKVIGADPVDSEAMVETAQRLAVALSDSGHHTCVTEMEAIAGIELRIETTVPEGVGELWMLVSSGAPTAVQAAEWRRYDGDEPPVQVVPASGGSPALEALVADGFSQAEHRLAEGTTGIKLFAIRFAEVVKARGHGGEAHSVGGYSGHRMTFVVDFDGTAQPETLVMQIASTTALPLLVRTAHVTFVDPAGATRTLRVCPAADGSIRAWATALSAAMKTSNELAPEGDDRSASGCD